MADWSDGLLKSLVSGWPVSRSAVCVLGRDGVLASHGDAAREYRIASVTKPLTAYATAIAASEGALDLDDAAGPDGATVRQLLAHTAGYGFDTDAVALAPPGTRRIYSNRGFDVLAEHVAAVTGIPFPTYLAEAVLQPLGMSATSLRGSAAHAGYSTLADLSRFAAELLDPRLLDPATVAGLVAVAFPGLSGVLPGVGRFDPLDWGLGFERNFGRPGHWAGERVSRSAFGHFGGSGTFLWVDPEAGVATACLTDREFDAWALAAWPPFGDAVIERAAQAG